MKTPMVKSETISLPAAVVPLENAGAAKLPGFSIQRQELRRRGFRLIAEDAARAFPLMSRRERRKLARTMNRQQWAKRDVAAVRKTTGK